MHATEQPPETHHHKPERGRLTALGRRLTGGQAVEVAQAILAAAR